MKKLLQMKFMLLLCALIVGSGTMWAEAKTLQFVQTSTSGGTLSGTVPSGVTATFSNTYTSNKEQLTNGNSMTLTLSGWATTTTIKGVTLEVKNNKNSGNGTATVTIGGTTLGTLSITGLGSTYQEKAISIKETLTTADLVITIACTTNSVYCDKFTITYEEAVVKTDPTITFNNGSVKVGKTLDLSTLFTSNSEGAVTYSITAGGDYASIDGSTLTGVAEGSVTVKAEQAAAGNYNAGEASATITVEAAKTLNSIAVTTEPAKTTYIEGETFDATGMVVTAYYADNTTDDVTASCTFTPSGALTTSDTEITISYTENAVEKTTTQSITVNALPKYTVTFSDGGSVTQASYGAEVTLPSRSEKAGYAFAGWSATNVATETTTAPTIIPAGAYTPTADITLYPVYSKTEGGGSQQNNSVSVNIGTYATANNWSNGTKYTSATLDENVTASVSNGSGNTGKYYSNNNSWRFYANESGKLTVSTTSGELTSVTITYTGNTLTYGGNNITSGTAVSVSGSSAEFSVSGSSGNTQITAISVDYTITGTGTTYYWSSPVAAAVEKPVITIAENPFLFSTTAEITCATSGATIKYSFDNENWNDYSEALTITETTTIYAKAVLDNDESAIASVEITKILAEPTVTIDASGITNTNVYTGTTAGNLAATVTYNETAIVGAKVTWSGNNDEVATINEETGVVTLVAAGTVTFTATYAGNSDYAEKTATYVMTVTNVDPNAPGTVNNPYTVAQALENTPSSGTSDNVYIRGIVSAFYGDYTDITGDYSHRYYISDDGTTTNQLLVYNGKGLNNVAFSNASDLQIGDVVTILGGLTTYNSTKEVAKDNYIVSLIRKPAAPTFSPVAGTYTSTQYVTISAADGAAIYYTTDGTDPTTESTQYSGAITVDESMTIKAIAVKDSEISTVATAEYVINLTPSIVFDGEQNPANVTYTAGETNIHYVASNITGTVSLVICDANGGETTYDWFSAELYGDSYVKVQWQANPDAENSRTAYFKLTDGITTSEVFALTQAKYVPDYAELPFAFNGGRADIEGTKGLTQEGLGSDYNATNNPTTKLKFDSTDDWMVLKINEIPGTLTFDIKGNGFSGSTFSVQTSADGVTFTDLASYTSIGSDTETKEFDDLADNVRYIKWVYTEKVSGNVGLGNINLAKPITDPVIKLAETSVEVDAKQHDGTIALTYKNLQIDSMDDFDVQFYSDEQGTVTADAPEWVEALVAAQAPNVGPGYVLSYVINANDGAARTAYLRVYANDGVNSVASDVVTITQAKFVKTTTYTLAHAITPGKHYVIASGDVGTVYVMGKQKSTNRDVVYGAEVNFSEVLSVTEDIAADVREFIISKDGNYYTIFDFDENESGYLYASSTSDNHLKTQATNNANGQWTITIDEEGVATLKANMTGRNWMRFNKNSEVFSCYGENSNQQDIYLFEKDNDEGSLVIPIAAACTDGTKCYSTFSSSKPFIVSEDLTVSEIGIEDGTMNVVNYATGETVPANTGVMVSATDGGNYVVNISKEAGTSVLDAENRLRPTGDNGLTATEMNSAEPETCKFYRLTMHNSTQIGFWWGADGGQSFDIAANKAYLAVPASVAGARNGFAFGDDATGISNVNVNENVNGSVFDLQGRKVSTPGKGLYIVNGKKVVIK